MSELQNQEKENSGVKRKKSKKFWNPRAQKVFISGTDFFRKSLEFNGLRELAPPPLSVSNTRYPSHSAPPHRLPSPVQQFHFTCSVYFLDKPNQSSANSGPRTGQARFLFQRPQNGFR